MAGALPFPLCWMACVAFFFTLPLYLSTRLELKLTVCMQSWGEMSVCVLPLELDRDGLQTEVTASPQQ